ncbi:hypothetical protein [Streptomyces kaempferi]|uniref:Uncharacterized protein n=1 Tax=Streptomyces kaempferi TaxID=333725 RepID=A0ABW3XWC8_9ACTN
MPQQPALIGPGPEQSSDLGVAGEDRAPPQLRQGHRCKAHLGSVRAGGVEQGLQNTESRQIKHA